jgi:hypothetical protein
MRLALHLLLAFTWGVIVQWPWGPYVFHAAAALGIIHLIAPWWSHFAFARPFHRAFLFGPMAFLVMDAGFVAYAWTRDLWSDLTIIAVGILAAGAIVGLLYSLLVMTLLDRFRARREAKKSGNDDRSG